MRPKHLFMVLIPLAVSAVLILALVTFSHPAKAGGVVSICDENHLREALAGGGTVTFTCSGMIVLTNTLIIADNTTIDGQGQMVTISGGNAKRVLSVNVGTSLSLNELTIADGYVCTLQGGGGIYNSGTLTVTNSTFLNNQANWGGAIYNNFGLISLTNTIFSGNTAPGGGSIYNLGTLSVYSSTFTNQGVTGGSIQSNGVLNVINSKFVDNFAYSWGGSIFIVGGSLTLIDSTFSGNSAEYGGGIYIQDGNVLVNNSTFVDNSATYKGGGIYIGDLGSLEAINSTFSGNSAAIGGGISIYFNNAPGPTISINNTTLAGNSASTGGGIAVSTETPQPFTLNLANTLISNNTGGNCAGDILYTGSGSLSFPDTSCPGINRDPKLGILRDNGGSTYTIALGDHSPAIDQGTADCPDTDQRGVPRPIDGDRDGQAECDIGSFEYQLFNGSFLPMVYR